MEKSKTGAGDGSAGGGRDCDCRHTRFSPLVQWRIGGKGKSLWAEGVAGAKVLRLCLVCWRNFEEAGVAGGSEWGERVGEEEKAGMGTDGVGPGELC